MGEENQRVRLTKRLLKDALVDLLEEKDLADIGVSELCSRAGINRTTFYNHYGNPADLADDIESEHLVVIRSRLDGLQREGRLDLATRVESICAYLRGHERVAKALFARGNDVSDFAAAVLGIGSAGAPELDTMLAGYDEVTRQLLVTYLTHGVYALVRKWLLEDVPKTPREMGELAAQVALRGWAQKG